MMIKRAATIATTTCLSLGAVLTPTDARGARTAASVGWGDTDIKKEFGSLINYSNQYRAAYVPVTVTSFKNYTLTARFRSNGVVQSGCNGMRIDGNNDYIFSATASETSNTYTTHSVGTLNIISGTSLVLRCTLAPVSGLPGVTSAVNAFDWT
jgi:hypothetical protein